MSLTTFSHLDAYGTPEQIIARAAEMGREVSAITDHGSISGFCKFEQACMKYNIKSIYGCEFYCSDEEKTKNRYHLTVLAKNLTGYKNLLKLVTVSWDNFYYVPLLKSSELLKYKEGLIILSGCLESKISKLAAGGNITETEDKIKKFRDIFRENFFLEIQPFSLDDSIKVNNVLVAIGKKLKIPVVVTNDVHYPTKEGQKIRRMLRAIRLRKLFDDVDADTQDMSIISAEEIVSRLRRFNGFDNGLEYVRNTELVAERCEVYSLPKSRFIELNIVDKEGLFEKLCADGMKSRGLIGTEYENRLRYEKDLIYSKKFIDYFLVVGDIVNWAKSNNIYVGPSRGSSAGSLVCYVMGITEVDPIVHGLLFERFIDVSRTDYPDIDVDIADKDRERVFHYVEEKYGRERVAHIGAFAQFHGKNSLDEVRRIYNLPLAEVETVKKMLLERSSADSRASYTIEDTIKKFSPAQRVVEKFPRIRDAMLLEGQYRHLGVHAAGVLIGDKSLDEYIALYTRNDPDSNSKEKRKVAAFEMEDIAYLGFIKIDILGLKALSVLSEICSKIGWTYSDMIKIPLDDKKTLEGFAKSDVLGIFQFEGRTTESLTGHIRPDTFAIVRDITALSKPGPLYSRDTSNYIMLRQNKDLLYKKKSDPIVDKITQETYGQILYQEQVMQIVREVGKFDWEDTAKIRKAMSKSLGQEFMSGYEEKFLKGAVENKYAKTEAKLIWDRLSMHGSWSYNKSHAVGYSVLAFWLMYMKQHHPTEFYWASLYLENNDNYKSRLMIEFNSRGGKVFPPRINHSKKGWEIEGGGLRCGLKEIKGIGDKTADTVISGYPFKNIEEMSERLPKRIFNSKIVKIISDNNLFNDEYSLDEIPAFRALQSIQRADITHNIKDLDFFDTMAGVINKDILTLGCFVREKVLYNIYEEDAIKGVKRNYSSPEQADLMILTLEDFTDTIKARVSRFLYPKYKDLLWKINENTPLKIVCQARERTRVLDVISIEEIG